MLVAISSSGGSLEDKVERFGRCTHFLLVEIEKKRIVKIDKVRNLLKTRLRPEPLVAKKLLDMGPKALLTEAIGPVGFRILAGSGIAIYTVSGKVKKALDMLLLKQLKKKAFYPELKEFGRPF